jgi:hypothetical protein
MILYFLLLEEHKINDGVCPLLVLKAVKGINKFINKRIHGSRGKARVLREIKW